MPRRHQGLAPALLLVLHEVGDAIRDRTERATGRETLPTAVLASLTAAARRGILIRSCRALEKLADVDVGIDN